MKKLTQRLILLALMTAIPVHMMPVPGALPPQMMAFANGLVQPQAQQDALRAAAAAAARGQQPQQQAPELTEEDKRTIQEALAEVNALDIDQIVEEAKKDTEADAEASKDTEADAEASFQEQVENIKWQNTLIWDGKVPLPIKDNGKLVRMRFGIYNQDMIDAGFYAADMGADFALYRFLRNSRIDDLCTKILEQPQELLSLLEELELANIAVQTNQEEQDKDTKKKNALAVVTEIKKLERYLGDAHRFIRFNPYKKETIVPLLMRFAAEFASKAIRENFAADQFGMGDLQNMFRDEYSRALFTTYRKDQEGKVIEEINSPNFFVRWPLSLFSIAKWFVSPFSAISESFSSTDARVLNLISSFLNMPYPEWATGKYARLSYNFLALGLVAKLYDSSCSVVWTKYVLSHTQELLPLLRTYAQLKQAGESNNPPPEHEIRNAINDIKKFVNDGHEVSQLAPSWGLLKQWVTAKSSGLAWARYPIFLAAIAPVAWRIAPYAWETIKNTIQNHFKGN